MLSKRVYLVTGANKGIGFEVVKKLSEKQPTDLILLGSRNQKRGEDAIIRLGSPSNVKVLILDVSSKESIEHAKQEIEEKHGGYIDVLINNAAIGDIGLSMEVLTATFNTNFYGVKQVNDTLSSLIRDNGCIVNVSSYLGAVCLKYCSEELQKQFLNPNLTQTGLEELFVSLFQAVQEGKDPQTVGFNSTEGVVFNDANVFYYSASKLGVNMLTRIEARDWNKKYGAKNVLISAVCPGFCATDLNQNAEGGRPAALGADSILHVVYNSEHLENALFWKDGERLSWK